MKLHIKLISLLLALLLLSLTFVSCDNPQGGGDTTAPDVSGDDTTAEITSPDRTVFELVADGKAAVKIVRPQNLSTSDPAVVAAIDIRKAINSATGISLALGDDWIQKGSSYDSEAVEILVGYTAHPEVADIAKDLGYGDYVVTSRGNKIIVLGFTAEAMSLAAKEFTNLVKKSASTDESGAKTLTLKVEDINISKTVDEYLSAVPIIESGELIFAIESGHRVREFGVDDVTLADYEKYLTTLESEGFTTHTTHTIVDNSFTVLYNSDYTVNVGYYDYSEEIRVTIEDYADYTLPALKSENTRPTVTTSQVTMIGCEEVYKGEYQTNGQSMLYRLSDGRFVIFDGGHSANSALYAANLVKELRAQSKDYAKTDKDIVIAAWIITHPHTDHFGVLVQQYKMFSSFTVECIMSNFVSEPYFDNCVSSSSSFATGKYKNYAQLDIIAASMGTDYVIPHVGHVYYIGDTTFEVLYTIESYYPATANAFNTTSLVVRSTTTDASGKSTQVIVTGDATGAAHGVCYNMYGQSLKCDILQIAHHGGNPYGNTDVLAQAYKAMAPSTLLWCIGTHKFDSVWNNAPNYPLYDTAQNPNYAESYTAGWNGTTVILPLPYTVGSAKVNMTYEK